MFKTAAGYFFLQLSLTGLVINLVSLIPLIRMMKRGDTQFVYLIAIITTLNAAISLFINCVYFAPTIIASHYIFADTVNALGPMIMTNIVQFSWYNGLFLMILMVTNRIVYLVLKKTEIFTKQRIIIFCVLAAVLSFFKILVNDFVIPCCIVYLDHEKYGYAIYNPKNKTDWSGYIDSSISIPVFVGTAFCYIVIYITLRNSAKEEMHQTVDKHQQKMRARERSAAVQFAYISLYYMITYATLRLTPLIFGEDHLETNMITPVVYALDGCATGWVFMFVNEEVKNEIFKRIFKSNQVQSQEPVGNTETNVNAAPVADNPEWMMYNQNFT
ncbi:Protein CBR-SRX-10 [Caenorhabditis briggsae]|uniref:Uncharacterized protein n=2 Tax=Caenorhabditis briggsae TaxID=6238 RepID=A0AAE9JHB9_CAEBR|nr:Protein CBR-SRX-10 [Caenorhabditis briggsae]ULT85895.1 hypothetical protein L3Y34_005942 [Caenorhabditis briggsae]UMM31649.1 hypothetical protein L5515_005761 [Caenorhabditis briggsae]CAP30535.2 Protein CBR-SRX-10 [Caenorhabditis briggsae]